VLSVSAAAASEEQRIFDKAELFSDSEISRLEEKISALREKSGYDIVIVSTDDMMGMNNMVYADDFYDYNGFDDEADYGFRVDGVLLLFNMEDRYIYISTCAGAQSVLSNDNVDKTLDKIYSYASDNDYYGCANAFLSEMDGYLIKSVSSTELLIIVFAALLVGLIFYFLVKRKYNSVGKKENYPFREQSRLNLTKREDVFVDKHVSSVIISSSSGSGGGSHTSSSGRSHGGGGRHF
jgi:uncharacterized protein